MKAADKCKEHFQGDRCGKEHLHDAQTNPDVDTLHQGQYQAWRGYGDDKHLVAKVARHSPKRNRQVNRIVRASCGKMGNYMLSGMSRATGKSATESLKACSDYLRGGKG